jgi:hypothetical protein
MNINGIVSYLSFAPSGETKARALLGSGYTRLGNLLAMLDREEFLNLRSILSGWGRGI